MTKIYIPCLIAEANEDILMLEKDGNSVNINIRKNKKWCEPLHVNINDLIVELLKMSDAFTEIKP